MPLLVVRTRQLSDMGHSTTTEVSGSLGGSQVKIELMRKRRATATKIRPGTAAMSDSDMFKLPADGKPLAKRWETHFSRESNRPPCVLKQAAGYIKTPGLISLGGGLPSSEYFPISEIAMCVPTAPNFSEKQHLLDSRASGAQIARIGKYDTRDGTSDFDISIAFNYGQATGSPQMMRWVTEHVDLVYNPPYADWGVCLTTGSTAALEQTVRMLCDRFRNDSILTEDYTFATAMETFVPQGIKVFGINMDEQGLLPGHMDHILETWDEGDRGARKPHLLYTVPSGQNPTGATQSLDRRREIYKVCQKHDMFIIEDEPYYFIQMKPYTGRGTEVVGNETVDDFLTRLVPTYLSMDVDGRVLRMDSFSKVLVPGSRMGWITASKEVIHKYLCHAEVANQGPSGISQLIIWKLVDETWGHEGYLRWLIDLRTSYTTRRNALLAACEDYLPTDIVSWVPPASGMFLWLKLDHTKHPDYQCRSLEEIEVEIFKNSIDQGVLFARGSWFRAEPHEELKELFLRVTFASAAEGDMCTAVQRLSAAIKKSFRIGF
ncbi:related to ARO8-aromatic amino acid aminotransferase I [Fusarium fujikuroi]|uniref:aromatic-amino-acid transaminase n=1 Tax=Gibberella fujikuroi (strain CBS 195.34 / IMI 58289 / NRRL A-6831) TaxID=1279085 RepID=S0EDX7_GIBF5|nr:related to ARO8-aromatic amino acid aminotransferase I [Fusarium fujikuroi IMI 58289]SCN97944.1 related to ARO8-aromatic amino acid aminotransferase I [Fusarium fujikuroi]CCT73131.1 related to ARO8-aromatic amino acid aminotransferase I [Fusarium fujikuroi IMI 58289]SCN99355.1 related to ARO8-aromatic amino acid aminotransferase I [Fusarium fujikuroi]SCO09393.1 related to ARO8-aromatic amino acid aminotransferase I [Fusarium fujikuroi]SCO16005.1 related to ARO8-aromatic amino acid aminotran